MVARWHAASRGGMKQAEFCARLTPPIKPRTLRQWCTEFEALAPTTEAFRALLIEFHNRLGGLLDALAADALTPAVEPVPEASPSAAQADCLDTDGRRPQLRKHLIDWED